jgi:hypothetical protein
MVDQQDARAVRFTAATDRIIDRPRERPMDDALVRELARWKRESYPVVVWLTPDM